MANALSSQITEDGYRNAVVKLAGILDTSDVVQASIINLQTFVGNEQNARLVGFRLNLVEWSISNPLEVNLEWNGAIPQQILPLAGRGRIDADNYGGFLPNQLNPGYDGSINLYTKNFQAGSIANFTVVLELVKLYKA